MRWWPFDSLKNVAPLAIWRQLSDKDPERRILFTNPGLQQRGRGTFSPFPLPELAHFSPLLHIDTVMRWSSFFFLRRRALHFDKWVSFLPDYPSLPAKWTVED